MNQAPSFEVVPDGDPVGPIRIRGGQLFYGLDDYEGLWVHDEGSGGAFAVPGGEYAHMHWWTRVQPMKVVKR